MTDAPVAEVSRISPQQRWAIAEHNVEIIRARQAYAEARAKETQVEIEKGVVDD